MPNQPQSFADYFAQVQATPGWDAIVQSFARFAAVPPQSRVLDVGCGPGSLARRLARARPSGAGIAADPLMIDRAQYLATEISGATFELGGVRKLRFSDGSFDAVLATNVLFLIPDPLAGLREMARVGRPGGVVGMLNPSPNLTIAAAESPACSRTVHCCRADGVRVDRKSWAGPGASGARPEKRRAMSEKRSTIALCTTPPLYDMSTIPVLRDKKILLGVTGSIAAYKAADLASKLTQAGALVDVILTEAATKFVTALTFQSVTGRRAFTDADLWGGEAHVLHVGLAHQA